MIGLSNKKFKRAGKLPLALSLLSFVGYNACAPSKVNITDTHPKNTIESLVILFDFDSDSITSETRDEILNKIKGKDYGYYIIGYASSDGYSWYNKDLSKRRADNVVKTIRDYDSTSTINTIYKGETNTFGNRKYNRRAVIEFRVKEKIIK